MNQPDNNGRIQETFLDLPPEFDDFKHVYREEILPTLLAREGDRRKAAARSKNFTYAAVALGVIGGGLGFLLFKSPFALFVAGIIGFGLHTYGQGPLREIRDEAKMLIVDTAARGFGLGFDPLPVTPPAIWLFKELGLIQSWDRSKYEDQLTGQRGKTTFEFFEAHLEDKRTTTDSRGNTRTHYVTVFKGQCLVLNFHKPFHGLTKVFRDLGMFNMFTSLGQKFSSQKTERVRLEDTVFEKAFEVFSNDQVEARFILTPDFMQKLLDLEVAFDGKKLRCAFSGGQLFLCVEGDNLFEPGSMHMPLDDPRHIQSLMNDFIAVFSLIDSVIDPDIVPHEEDVTTSDGDPGGDDNPWN